MNIFSYQFLHINKKLCDFCLPNDDWETPSYDLPKLVIIWCHDFLSPCYSNVVHRPQVSATPGNFFELQTLRPPQPTKLGNAFKEIPADLFETLKLKKYCSTKGVLEWYGKLYFSYKSRENGVMNPM